MLSSPNAKDHHFMQQALRIAEIGVQENEVPIGAVLVKNDEIIASASNAPIASHDPTAHAEILVLRQGAAKLDNYRLTDCTLYVTLEPCCMCVGAIVHARLDRLVYAAFDQKTGCVSSHPLIDQPFFNHRVKHLGGICKDESLSLLRHFFQTKR